MPGRLEVSQNANKRIKDGLNEEFVKEDSDVIIQTRSQLTEYFEGNRSTFDIPLLLVGSDFQRSVWEALSQIPFGTTESYLGLSRNWETKKR